MDQDEATLYQLPPPPEEAGPLRGAAHHRRKASEVASLASSQRKRPRSGEIETSAAPATSRIERWLRIGCNSQGVGQVDTPPRRLHSPSPNRPHRVDDVQPGGESIEHHTGPRGGGREWNHLRINEPGKINRTLRHTLLIFVFDALRWLVSPSAPQAEMAADAQWAYLLRKDSKLQAAPELGASCLTGDAHAPEMVRSGSVVDDRCTTPSGPHRAVAADEGSPGASLRTGPVNEAGSAPVPKVLPQVPASSSHAVESPSRKS